MGSSFGRESERFTLDYKLTEEQEKEFERIVDARRAETVGSDLEEQELGKMKSQFFGDNLIEALLTIKEDVISILATMNEEELRAVTEDNILDNVREKARHPELVDSIQQGSSVYAYIAFRNERLAQLEKERRKANKKWWEFWV